MHNGSSKGKDSSLYNTQQSTEHAWMRSVITGKQKTLVFYVRRISSLILLLISYIMKRGFRVCRLFLKTNSGIVHKLKTRLCLS
jgi:hypothetical protein